MPEEEYSFLKNPAWAAGNALGRLVDAEKPMGSWTGLDPILGAPLSGALWGAGLGGVYSGIRSLSGKPRRRGDLLRHLRNGALLGAATGVASGAAQKMAFAQQNLASRVFEVIANDPYMLERDKGRILAALQGASDAQLRQLLAAAVGGGLTAFLASNILGLGGFGSAVAGGVGLMLAKNYFGSPRYAV